MFYQVFKALCEKKHVSPSRVAETIGLNRSAATSWKRGIIPSQSSLDKLAAYFGVSRQYLLDGVDDGKTSVVLDESREDSVSPTISAEADEVKPHPEEARSESRLFMELAFDLLRLYRSENNDSLIEKLDMLPGPINALLAGHGESVPVDKDWYSRFYLLLENQDSSHGQEESSVYKLFGALRRMADVLNREWSKQNIRKMNKAIQSYMYQRGIENVTDIEEIDLDAVAKGLRHQRRYKDMYYAIARTGNSDKVWAFCFTVVYGGTMATEKFTKGSLAWVRRVPNVEELCFMFIYAPDYGDDGDLTRIKKTMSTFCQSEIDMVLSDTPIWLAQIHSQTRDIISYEPWSPSEEANLPETTNN